LNIKKTVLPREVIHSIILPTLKILENHLKDFSPETVVSAGNVLHWPECRFKKSGPTYFHPLFSSFNPTAMQGLMF